MKRNARGRRERRRGNSASFTVSAYRGATGNFAEEEKGRIAYARASGLLCAFERAVREVFFDRVPKDMERFYIGFFKKAIPQEFTRVPQSLRDVFGEGVQFWVAEGIAAVITLESLGLDKPEEMLCTFIPVALIQQQEDTMPIKQDIESRDGWYKTRYNGYTAGFGSFSQYINNVPNVGSFGRGSLY